MSLFKRIALASSMLGGCSLLGGAMATQYVAEQFSYHKNLAGVLVKTEAYSVYAPWMFWKWLLTFGEEYPDIFNVGYALQMGSIFGGIIGFVILSKILFKDSGDVKPFGLDKWASEKEIKGSALWGNKNGVILGRLGQELLKHNGSEHILILGATRSGKGVGIVVPSLWDWRGSAIIYDPKPELWDLTAGKRAEFSNVAYFDPSCQDSIKINPLLSVRKGVHEMGDVQNIVQFLSNPDATQQQRNIWEESGKRLVSALILHVLYSEEDDRKNLSVVREKVLDFDNTLKEMLCTPHRLNAAGEPEVHPEVFRVAKGIYTKYKKFRESVSGTAETYLELWADEVIARATSQNDFNVAELFDGKRPFTIYLRFPYSDRERLMPLVKFTLSQMLRGIFREGDPQADRNAEKHKILLLIDEFPTLGKMSFLEDDMGVAAGFGVKAVLVCQDANAIENKYNQNTTIFSNCYIQVYSAASDPRTQKRMSDMAGKATEIRESMSNQKDYWGFKRGSSISFSEVTRPILQESQARELDSNQHIIYMGSSKPMKVDKFRFDQHEHLKKLVSIKPPTNKDLKVSPVRNDWVGERQKGKLLPMPDIKVEREDGETLQDDGAYSKARKAVSAQNESFDFSKDWGE